MPLLLSADTTGVADGRSIQLGDLPLFNAADDSFKITSFEGWFDRAAPDAVYVPNGAGAGAVASGPWLAKEMVYQLRGRVLADRAALGQIKRLLFAALPMDRDVPIICYGNGFDVDLQIFVRCYDKPDITIGPQIGFSFPLLACDPFKYALQPLGGSLGATSGQTWFWPYGENAGVWQRQYALAGGRYSRTYQQMVPTFGYPESLQVTSDGDAVSNRVTISIVGPLTAGAWWIHNEATGDRLVGRFGISSDQTLVLDTAARSALLNGADVSYGMLGDWPTLAPGTNTYRLVTGTETDAFATVEAFEAYQ